MRVKTYHNKKICYLQNKSDITKSFKNTGIHKSIFRYSVAMNTGKRLKMNQVRNIC